MSGLQMEIRDEINLANLWNRDSCLEHTVPVRPIEHLWTEQTIQTYNGVKTTVSECESS